MSDISPINLLECFQNRVHVQEEMIRLIRTENHHLKMALGPLMQMRDIFLRHLNTFQSEALQIEQCLGSLDSLFRMQPEVFQLASGSAYLFAHSKQQSSFYSADKANKFNIDSQSDLSSVEDLATSPSECLSKSFTSEAIRVNDHARKDESLDADKVFDHFSDFSSIESNSKNKNNFQIIDQDLRTDTKPVTDSFLQIGNCVEMYDEEVKTKKRPNLNIMNNSQLNLDKGGKYCICKKASSGKMIWCDNSACQNGKWFHFACVGLTVEPKVDKWLCPNCAIAIAIEGQIGVQQANEGYFKCKLCGKKCAQLFLLKRHVRIHLKARFHRCTWHDCTYSSPSRSNVYRHVRTKHFGLPQTVKEQMRKNIVDSNDPNEYIQSLK